MRKFHVLFIVAVAALFTSCKKDEPVNNNSNGQYYFDAVIGGVQVKEVIPFNNMDMNLIAGSSLGGIDDVVFSANISNQNPGGSEMAISKGLMHNYTSATANEF